MNFIVIEILKKNCIVTSAEKKCQIPKSYLSYLQSGRITGVRWSACQSIFNDKKCTASMTLAYIALGVRAAESAGSYIRTHATNNSTNAVSAVPADKKRKSKWGWERERKTENLRGHRLEYVSWSPVFRPHYVLFHFCDPFFILHFCQPFFSASAR